MKKTWKKVVSLLMSVMVVFSMMGVPVMAEEAKAAPTEVSFLYSQRTLDDSPELCIQGHCLDECDQQCDRQWYSVYEQNDQQL